jgi:hypothetical protein
MALAQSPNQPTQSTKDDNKNTTAKKAGANPKKPAESAKNNGDADKVKTDERMSTRGLKPPPKDNADKDKSANPNAKSSAAPVTDKPK